MSVTPHSARSTKARSSAWLIGLLGVAVLATRLAFLYRASAGEPDAVVMAAGMLRYLTGAADLSHSILYGRQNGPGTYLFILPLLAPLLRNAGSLLTALNLAGALSSSLLCVPLYFLMRHSLSRRAALAATALTVFSPVAWEVGTYYHPISMALLLWCSAAALLAGTLPGGRCSILRAAAICLCAAVAFLVRTEVIFTLPGLLMCLVIARPSLRLWLVVLIALLVTLLGYLYVESWLSVGPSARSSLSRYALWFVRDFVRVNSVGRNAFYAILAVGVASVMGALLAFVGAFRSRDTARLHACAAAIAIALPALVFWLPNWVPTPRHFLLVAPIVAWFVATRLPRDAGRVRVVAIVCAVALANVLLPELVYGTYARFHPRHPKTPHGSFFAQHAVVRERAARFQRLGSDVEQGLEQPVPDDRPLTALVGWEAYGYLLYDLGAAGVAVQEPHVQRLAGGIELRTYRIRDHGVLHLLVADRQVWIADPGSMQRMLAHFASISSTAWVPREAIDDRVVSGLRPGLNAY